MVGAMIDKVGLAVIRDGKLLLVRNAGTEKLLMPGGRREKAESDVEALVREIGEELSCAVIPSTLQFVGTFDDVAANDPGRFVQIRLYTGELAGNPAPSAEVAEIVWFDVRFDDNSRLSQIVRRWIIPGLTALGALPG